MDWLISLLLICEFIINRADSSIAKLLENVYHFPDILRNYIIFNNLFYSNENIAWSISIEIK